MSSANPPRAGRPPFVEENGIIASIPCTCGELFQGSLDGEPCLVSCPIDIFSAARLPDDKRGIGSKARRALALLPLPSPFPGGLSAGSPLPAGRGYGTSTADIGAALHAASRWAGMSLSDWEVARIAVAIEPTDSTLFAGLALFSHREGRFHEPLGPAPALRVLILDPGGFIDTEVFNRQCWKTQLRSLAAGHRRAFELLRQGIAEGRTALIGEAATRSALLHQAILPSPLLEPALDLCGRLGGLGVCRAHSGTLVGLLFNADGFDQERALCESRQSIPRGVHLRVASLVDGGARFHGTTAGRHAVGEPLS